MSPSFEQGPIRPPSEAKSLLIRVTRNCPWNKCAFCHTYRGGKFEPRPLSDIKKDIETVADIVETIKTFSWKLGEGGRISNAVIGMIYSSGNGYTEYYRSVAAWLYYGGESVFIQDADSLIIKTADIAEILSFVRETFPFVKRITTYCRSKTAARKTPEDLIKLKEAGLSRIHVGMESGYDPVLEFIRKGVTAADHVSGGRKIKAAGISLSEYIIPGLGGARWSRQHAEETAKIINMINPDFVRLRTLHLRPGTALYAIAQEGAFIALGDEEILKELRLFINNLDGIETTIVSDHILNLLEELEGTLPHDKEKLLGIIDRYLQLSEEERLIYRLGRRRGIYRALDDLNNTQVYLELKDIIDKNMLREPADMDRYLSRLMSRYI
ncbi:MAG: radical SAM protein [Deltaproteobacteria bacterium]|nr:radical SAM protein [Deltaproteobacteria bacterium]